MSNALTIKTNVLHVTDYLLRELGFLVPSTGGSVVIDEDDELQAMALSIELKTRLTDDVYGAGSSTLILNDGISDLPQSEAVDYLTANAAQLPDFIGATGALDGFRGAVPAPDAGEETYLLRGDGSWAIPPAGGAPVTVKEQDGSPSIAAVDEIRVPNDSLTDEGGGAVSLDFAAATDYAGRFEQASIGTGDIGTDKWGWWYDTVNSQLYLVRNRSGTLFYVETNC